MNNIMNTAEWYANDASNDKYVTCMSSMIEQMRVQGFAVACRWLEVTGNVEHRKRFTLRRRYWLLTVRLKYAEYVGSEPYVHEVRRTVNDLQSTLDDAYCLKMFQVLEIACYLSLYRISDGRVLPLFKNYHKQLLGIVDDFMAMQQENFPSKPFVEDCSRVFDLVEDIERISGSHLYKTRLSNNESAGSQIPSEHYGRKEQQLDKALNYITHWLCSGHSEASQPLMKDFLKAVESVKRKVDRRLSINTDILFYEGVYDDEIREKIQQSRVYLTEALSNEGIRLEHEPFWQLYTELIIKKSVKKMGKSHVRQSGHTALVRQAAGWSLHEKMHDLIPSLLANPAYLRHLLVKKLIKPEALLYGVFSTLAVQNIPVVYCEYDVLDENIASPKLKLNRQNGSILEDFYEEIAELVYGVSRSREGEGFSLQPHTTEAPGLLDMACIYTDRQVVMLGMSNDFTINNHYYASSEGILGQLIGLAGYKFTLDQRLMINSANRRSGCRKQCAEFKSCKIDNCGGFVNNFIEATISLKKRGKMYVLEEKAVSDESYVAEVIDTAYSFG